MTKMKYAALAAVAALALGVAAPAQATMLGHVATYGEDFQMQFNGHPMHLQMLTDDSGNEWVVMSKADAEVIMGTMPHHK